MKFSLKKTKLDALISYFTASIPLLEKVGPSVTKQEICYSVSDIIVGIFSPKELKQVNSISEVYNSIDLKFWTSLNGSRFSQPDYSHFFFLLL